jgi:gamma-tubulin complex component 2
MVMNECQLLKRLQSINHYFFFDKGDFFSHFIDGCEEILEKFTSEVKIEKLESLLEMAIRTSSTQSDPFKDDVSCELNSYGVSEQLLVTCLTRGALGSEAFSGGSASINTALT